MPKLIIVTSLMLFWAFYEMSGGADFQPLEREPAVARSKAIVPPLPEAEETVVTFVAEPQVTPQVVAEQEAAIERVGYEREPVLISTAAPVSAPEPADPRDIRLVTGDWVNMRDGPSTAFDVLNTLPKGTEAEIIASNSDGWAQIRLLDSGQTGWMAERLLTDG
ncbi:SH3 domain-containing protein [Yoonia sp. 2307UL14-13]|uniref:SH3 domain-containing protein n=1 Tax=Yoonia sp. 2307UL14-13 TaxID=3126506 RepID=UPI003099E672